MGILDIGNVNEMPTDSRRGSPGAGVTGTYEPPDVGAREPNLGPYQEQPLLLIVGEHFCPANQFPKKKTHIDSLVIINTWWIAHGCY